MITSNVNLETIKKNLIQVPKYKLSEINEFILLKHQNRSQKIVKFEGIWDGIGFEKITNLKSEIQQIRKKSAETLEKRIEKWNI